MSSTPQAQFGSAPTDFLHVVRQRSQYCCLQVCVAPRLSKQINNNKHMSKRHSCLLKQNCEFAVYIKALVLSPADLISYSPWCYGKLFQMLCRHLALHNSLEKTLWQTLVSLGSSHLKLWLISSVIYQLDDCEAKIGSSLWKCWLRFSYWVMNVILLRPVWSGHPTICPCTFNDFIKSDWTV